MRAALATLLLLFPLSATAAAESGAHAWSLFSAGIFEKSAIPVRTTTLRGLQPAAETGTELPVAALTFVRTRKQEMQARERLLASLLATTDESVARRQIRESVTNDDIWREFDRILSFAGYSSRNLADVTTAYYVITWEVVSGGHAIDHLGGIRLVRDSVAVTLRSDPRLAAMSNADKHEAAVVMAYMAIVAAHRARELRESGDQAGLARLREQVRRSVLGGQGVDLAALRLTNVGFVVD